MSVSSNLLCSFELLKPLDSSALKSHIKKGRNARQNMLNSPVSLSIDHVARPVLTRFSLLKYLLRASRNRSWAMFDQLAAVYHLEEKSNSLCEDRHQAENLVRGDSCYERVVSSASDRYHWRMESGWNCHAIRLEDRSERNNSS